jgi:hypothetical protein
VHRRIAHGFYGLDTDLRDFATVFERLKRIFQYKKYSIFCIAAIKDKSRFFRLFFEYKFLFGHGFYGFGGCGFNPPIKINPLKGRF